MKKKILSGIQPSGNLCISNYIGAIKNWVKLQDDYECTFLVVDLHSITVRQNPSNLRNRCLSFVAQYIACGINPKNIVIQSHVPQHSELMWLLASISYIGELNRMTQYKDKSDRNKDNINLALFSYPVLMASDILLYQADLVPVGADQKQHLELARDLANRFNTNYSETFKLPEPFIKSSGSRIMSLQNPDSKMSKSDVNPNNYIALLDDPKIIKKKIKRAVTDSGNEIRYDKEGNAISNLITIFSEISDNSIASIEKDFEGKLYSDFKEALADLIIDELAPIQESYKQLINDRTYLKEVLKENSDNAYKFARKTLSKVQRKLGFVSKV
tara:strand:- start:288 stop:1274 length:987 start_codon:yes stop_codon:yes gene_type:complete